MLLNWVAISEHRPIRRTKYLWVMAADGSREHDHSWGRMRFRSCRLNLGEIATMNSFLQTISTAQIGFSRGIRLVGKGGSHVRAFVILDSFASRCTPIRCLPHELFK